VPFGQGRPLSEPAPKLLSVQGQLLHTNDAYRTVDVARRNFSQSFIGGFGKDEDIFAFFRDTMKSTNVDCRDLATIQCDVLGTSARAGIKIEIFFNIRHDATGFFFGFAKSHFSCGLARFDDSRDDFNGPRFFLTDQGFSAPDAYMPPRNCSISTISSRTGSYGMTAATGPRTRISRLNWGLQPPSYKL
jgi:hypothetical protein